MALSDAHTDPLDTSPGPDATHDPAGPQRPDQAHAALTAALTRCPEVVLAFHALGQACARYAEQFRAITAAASENDDGR